MKNRTPAPPGWGVFLSAEARSITVSAPTPAIVGPLDDALAFIFGDGRGQIQMRLVVAALGAQRTDLAVEVVLGGVDTLA